MKNTTRLDLTNQRYGKLTVLRPVPNIGTRTAWLCRCECGTELVVKTVHLRNGHVRTCGCVSIKDRVTLVDGTCVEMLQASTVRKNNTSGVSGVEWQSKEQRWRATICFKGKRHYLGRFARLEDAIKARKDAEDKYYKPFLAEYDNEQDKLPK